MKNSYKIANIGRREGSLVVHKNSASCPDSSSTKKGGDTAKITF